jgi:hypothetical protein
LADCTLRGRPVVGEPVDIDLALIPGQDLDRVYAVFQAADGLELTKGGKTAEIEHPRGGVPISHILIIVSQRDSVFYVSAVVLADSIRHEQLLDSGDRRGWNFHPGRR